MTLDDLERPLRTLLHYTCVYGDQHANLNEDRSILLAAEMLLRHSSFSGGLGRITEYLDRSKSVRVSCQMCNVELYQGVIMELVKTNINTRMRGKAQRDGHPLGGSKLPSYFWPFVDQSTHGYVRIFRETL